MPDFIVDNRLYHNPVEFVMNKIGGTYKMPILWRLKDKPWRFSELKNSLTHASDRMLAKSLNELVEDGFVSKKIYAEVPARVEYSITTRGQSSIPVIDAIRRFGLELLEKEGDTQHTK